MYLKRKENQLQAVYNSFSFTPGNGGNIVIYLRFIKQHIKHFLHTNWKIIYKFFHDFTTMNQKKSELYFN